MTSLTSTTPLSAHDTPASMDRIWKVVRLNTVNKRSILVVPWMVLAFIWLVNFSIWWIIYASTPPAHRAHAMQGTSYSGAEFYIFIYMLVIAVQIISVTFRFALGFSVTRRDFYLGSALTFGMLAAGYSIALTLLSYIEQWTNGWGLGGHMFSTLYLGNSALWQRLFIVFVGFLFCFFVGAAAATIFMRWRGPGLLIAGACLAILIVAGVAIATMTQSWPAIGAWFVQAGTLGVVSWLLVPTAIAGVAGFFILRRATPRS